MPACNCFTNNSKNKNPGYYKKSVVNFEQVLIANAKEFHWLKSLRSFFLEYFKYRFPIVLTNDCTSQRSLRFHFELSLVKSNSASVGELSPKETRASFLFELRTTLGMIL